TSVDRVSLSIKASSPKKPPWLTVARWRYFPSATGSRIRTPPRRTRNISSPDLPVEKSLCSLFNETSETHSLIFDNSSSAYSRNKEKSFSSKCFHSFQWRHRAHPKFALPSSPLRCPLCRKSSRLCHRSDPSPSSKFRSHGLRERPMAFG